MWILLLWSTGSRAHRLQYLWYMGLVAPQHVRYSWIRGWTHVSCIGRGTPYHGTTGKGQQANSLPLSHKEAPWWDFFFEYLFIWLCLAFVVACRLLLCSTLDSLVVVHMGSICCFWAAEHVGFGSCGTQAQLPQGIWNLRSPARDWTHTSYIARQVLNHWTTREVPWWDFKWAPSGFCHVVKETIQPVYQKHLC